jgi:hypothetical protein
MKRGVIISQAGFPPAGRMYPKLKSNTETL